MLLWVVVVGTWKRFSKSCFPFISARSLISPSYVLLSLHFLIFKGYQLFSIYLVLPPGNNDSQGFHFWLHTLSPVLRTTKSWPMLSILVLIVAFSFSGGDFICTQSNCCFSLFFFGVFKTYLLCSLYPRFQWQASCRNSLDFCTLFICTLKVVVFSVTYSYWRYRSCMVLFALSFLCFLGS